MPFERIWDVGGFVFSDLVSCYQKKEPVSNLLEPDKSNSFFRTSKKKKERKDEKEQKNEKETYEFIGRTEPNEIIRERYQDAIDKDKGKVKFKSRFTPTDYYCIYTTLDILKKDYKRSIFYFMSTIYEKNKGKQDIIRRILFALHLLTYHEIGQPKVEELKTGKMIDERAKKVKDILENHFDAEFEAFQRGKIFQSKRAWCGFRDFLKSSEFNQSFKKTIGSECVGILCKEESLAQFELPGDVWNNNTRFGKCVLKGAGYEGDKRSFNHILRAHYDEHLKGGNDTGYPEQFDVTFDFVPRMCEKENCYICPIDNIDKKNSWEKTCVENKEKYCSVALIGGNYESPCQGKENCKLHKIFGN
jgi:hypothetical protein